MLEPSARRAFPADRRWPVQISARLDRGDPDRPHSRCGAARIAPPGRESVTLAGRRRRSAAQPMPPTNCSPRRGSAASRPRRGRPRSPGHWRRRRRSPVSPTRTPRIGWRTAWRCSANSRVRPTSGDMYNAGIRRHPGAASRIAATCSARSARPHWRRVTPPDPGGHLRVPPSLPGCTNGPTCWAPRRLGCPAVPAVSRSTWRTRIASQPAGGGARRAARQRLRATQRAAGPAVGRADLHRR